MEIGIAVLVFVVSYLLGSLSFGRIVGKILDPEVDLEDVSVPLQGEDKEASYRLQSVGGNTVSIRFGGRVGCLVGLLDILKAFVPTLVVRLLFPDQPYMFIAAIAAFAGHNWPIYYRFKGGRGVSPFYGGLFAIDPIGAVVVAVISMLIGMLLLKELLFAYAGGILLALPWFLITKFSEPEYMIYSLIIFVLFILAMIPELRQMREMGKKYGKSDIAVSLDRIPMGQSMLRMLEMLGLRKKEAVGEE